MMTPADMFDDAALWEFDRRHLWHPYTSLTDPLPVFPVKETNGVRIILEDGRELIDGMSSWWSVIHGYSHPKLVRALKDQAETMSHVMFGGLTHRPAVELAQRLVALTPEGLDRIFICDSGSVAVEVAMKMAIQYYHALGDKKKCKFATIRSGYHGDTFHAMSVCDPVTGMHHLFSTVLPHYYFASRPECRYDDEWQPEDITPLETILVEHRDELCGVILEPIVQGAGGMRFYHPQYLRAVRKLCTEHDILLIADEIATGFGRSGRLFGCNHAAVIPDIMCVGKALTGGMMTLAAAITTEQVAVTISSGDPGVFMHGPTFMGNPLACSVAVASLNLLEENDWYTQVRRIEQKLREGLQPCSRLSYVRDVRVLGAIGVVECNQPVQMKVIQEHFVGRGVWVRPFGSLVYLMPPYCINDSDIDRLTSAVTDVLQQETIFS